MIGGHKCIQEVGNYAPFFDLIFGSRVVRHGEGRGRETAPMVEGGPWRCTPPTLYFRLMLPGLF